MSKKIWSLIAVMLVLSMLVAACAPAAAPATTAPAPAATTAPAAPAATTAPAPAAGTFQIPEVEEGKFNIAAVLIGPHDDGGWSQAHYEGLKYVEQNMPTRTSPTWRTCRKAPSPSRSFAAWRARASI